MQHEKYCSVRISQKYIIANAEPTVAALSLSPLPGDCVSHKGSGPALLPSPLFEVWPPPPESEAVQTTRGRGGTFSTIDSKCREGGEEVFTFPHLRPPLLMLHWLSSLQPLRAQLSWCWREKGRIGRRAFALPVRRNKCKEGSKSYGRLPCT